jgi:O-acetylhomoserine/O-acetylserine sulfhydrylase-like pyridoxal-dependent enzyme
MKNQTQGPSTRSVHSELSPDEIKASGVSPELIRYSAGIEDVDDLIYDLKQALESL